MADISVFVRLWHYFRDYRVSFFLAIFLKIINVIMNVIEPFIIGLSITEITNNLVDIARGVNDARINFSYIGFILIVYFCRGIVSSLCVYGSNYYMTHVIQLTIRDIRNDLNQKVNRIPVSYFDNHRLGDIVGRFISDVEVVSNALQQSFLQIINAVFTVSLVFFMVLYINLPLGLIVICSMPVSYLVADAILKQSKSHFKKQARVLGNMNGFIQENLTGFYITQLYGREDVCRRSFHEITDEFQRVGFKASFVSSMMMPILSGISNLSYLLLSFYGGMQVLTGKLTIGNLQALGQYGWQINQPIQIIAQFVNQIQSAKYSLERIFEVLDETDEVSGTVVEQLSVDLTGNVVFDSVNFSYVENRSLINNFNLNVTPGQMIAIVGPTGAGKTTLINLLMRFYDVTKGSIRVDGRDIRNLDRREYRKNFGMVLQDAWLFEGTIEENIRFGNLNASDEEIIEAAKTANVDHFIRTLPGGYNMIINQESGNISQGQKQLFTIARALLSNPKILILDEATSSVDPRLELLIQKAMTKLMEGRTSFVIAHRLSTIQEADNILVLKEGTIVEQGNHQSLLRKKGMYYDLCQSQFSE